MHLALPEPVHLVPCVARELFAGVIQFRIWRWEVILGSPSEPLKHDNKGPYNKEDRGSRVEEAMR